MAIIKVNKTKDYTIISNAHFRERDMSLKAKGLLSLMLSLPEQWNYTVSGLVSICKENESAINSTLSELKKFRYLKVDKLMPNKTSSGRIEYVYNIFESPYIEEQDLEKQDLENQGVENQGQYNTNKLSTNNIKDIVGFASLEEEIVNYLNLKAETKYRTDTANTKQFILRRLKEKFTLDDFKKVIDNKVKEWKGTNMEQYLRPATLFGNKFESYLNSKIVSNTQDKPRVGRDYSKNELNGLFDKIEEVEL